MKDFPVIRALLVDDDEDDFVMFRDHLAQVEGQKYEVTWASSFEAGREAIAKGEHDVGFLDYRLGIKTGIDLLREAKERKWAMPLILLTGYGEQEVDMEAMSLGAADYLVKDQVSPLLLERSIRYSMHRARSLKALLDREAQILVQDRLASVGLLASSLAHEIGTPLGVIRGRAEYLEMKMKDDPEVTKTAHVIISQIDRVSKLIRSLLNLARGEQSGGTEPVSPRHICEELCELMGHEFRKHEIRMECDLDEKVMVKAESGPLHQVMLNLMVNSLHAIETAKAAGRNHHFIRLDVDDRGEFWGVRFKDSGCGISEKNLKNLFQPFFTTKDIGKGTGLGLATSYRIVERWGGNIEVKSKEGQGTEFLLLLPKA